MADIYVRSTDGLDTDNGTTWALAKATLTGAAAIDAVGDNIYISQAHSESPGATVAPLIAGTITAPVKVICVNDSTGEATTGAVIASSGEFDINLNTGTQFYMAGIRLRVGVGATGTRIIRLGGGLATYQTYENCFFEIASTGVSSLIQPTNITTSSIRLFNCWVKFAATGQSIDARSPRLYWVGGGIEAGSSAITKLFSDHSTSAPILLRDLDLSAGASSIVIFGASAANSRNLRATLVNCRLPSPWTGSLVSSPGEGCRVSMYNCDSGATNYRLLINSYEGTITSETTIVKTGGASDGTTALSWKMVTSANANEHVSPLVSDDMAIWLDTVGTSKTISVDIIHDSTTALKDSEVWLEISYLPNSTTPLGSDLSDKRATIVTAAADQTTSTATWTTTGLTNPNKQKLEVTFTNQMKGFVYARVYLAKPSYTIYVDYEPTVT